MIYTILANGPGRPILQMTGLLEHLLVRLHGLKVVIETAPRCSRFIVVQVLL